MRITVAIVCLLTLIIAQAVGLSPLGTFEVSESIVNGSHTRTTVFKRDEPSDDDDTVESIFRTYSNSENPHPADVQHMIEQLGEIGERYNGEGPWDAETRLRTLSKSSS
jgi:hypothetical protein